MIYYLELHKLYTNTTKSNRAVIRKSLSRNSIMSHKLKHQKHRCFYCGESIDMKGHLDHLVPVYYGGDNRLRNLVASCRDCNLVKNTQQLVITNEETISDYIKLIEAKNKWDEKIKCKPYLKRYTPKRVQLYKVLRADLFRGHKND